MYEDKRDSFFYLIKKEHRCYTSNNQNYEIKGPLDLATKITDLGKKGLK